GLRLPRLLLRLPMLYKVLVANACIVMVGAIGGTWTTLRVAHADDATSQTSLILLFAALGLIASVAVNFLVLRAAFQPILSLERVAAAVRAGDMTARALPTTFGDPQVARLAETFNATLDELARDREQLRYLSGQVIRAQEDERKRIARELHDDTAQILFAQLLRLTGMKASPYEQVRLTAEQLEETTVEAIEGVRRLALELRPPSLDDLGLREALDGLAQRFGEQLGFPVEFVATGERGRLPAEVELVLYRVAQEALTNVAKHAMARSVSMFLERHTDGVTIRVRDDGRGFALNGQPRPDGKGLGLFGMEERLALVGGNLSITSLTPGGTEVRGDVPLRSRHTADST
ncbi:MAG: sensor histidine kinase, partial [Actinomycetota bacterium]|nr:sensor histidine kinase [Actinomycetota bacterium]